MCADIVSADFHALGLGEPFAISASHARGCEELMERVLAGFEPQAVAEADSDAIRIAIIGRPNVGKSTLVNRLLGEERVIAHEEPGTTRDSILVPFERDGRAFLLIGIAVDAAYLTQSVAQSVEQGTPRPAIAQAIRTVGSWGGAWAGAKLGCAAGGLAGVETGPGMALTCLAGGIVGGFAGYFGADWIADMISED